MLHALQMTAAEVDYAAAAAAEFRISKLLLLLLLLLNFVYLSIAAASC